MPHSFFPPRQNYFRYGRVIFLRQVLFSSNHLSTLLLLINVAQVSDHEALRTGLSMSSIVEGNDRHRSIKFRLERRIYLNGSRSPSRCVHFNFAQGVVPSLKTCAMPTLLRHTVVIRLGQTSSLRCIRSIVGRFLQMLPSMLASCHSRIPAISQHWCSIGFWTIRTCMH
ncbi:hypothetical protein BDQ12DRAFT_679268 [Crucibulum laeve]|uniref:Uncharacterized protein n=1 Tax=Crucibulum laeve TaxID=68775 RepID=A0A5C3M9F7_9AGAR|nr:hypothetical protein BDQ12DRAFT_679268 [Crucibulum laeve]